MQIENHEGIQLWVWYLFGSFFNLTLTLLKKAGLSQFNFKMADSPKKNKEGWQMASMILITES